MPVEWQLIDTGIRPAYENIALDSAFLNAKASDRIPNTLRFLQYSPRTVLIGYHQTVAQEIRTDYCRKNGIDVNRRITGGGAIFFDESQIGWELICSRYDLGGSLDRITRQVCEAVVRGLDHLGVHAAFRPRNDIEVRGRKISGTGGIFEEGAVLFQGTLLVDFDIDTMVRALNIPTEKLGDRELKSARERVTCIREELGEIPPGDAIKAALGRGFEEILGVRLVPADVPAAVLEDFDRRKNDYRKKNWVHAVREPTRLRRTLRAFHKGRGGIIRVALSIDMRRALLKQALITGDFFISPARAVFDLEAAVREVPLARIDSRIEAFFERTRPHLTGLTANDFIAAFSAALEKVEYPALGISLEEANHVFTVNGALPDILKTATVLLLPYCAKQIGCEYRYNEGCDNCGDCSVGSAYEMADRYGLTPITVQNYEHLKEILERCAREGVGSYIGCCCEAFFAKRQRLFREIGIPGALLDIENSTCYDLDREREAEEGKFENQTQLRLELLKKAMSHTNTGLIGVTERRSDRRRHSDSAGQEMKKDAG